MSYLEELLPASFLIVVGMFIAGIGFFLYPFKKIRYFCGGKAMHLMDTADYFLGEAEK